MHAIVPFVTNLSKGTPPASFTLFVLVRIKILMFEIRVTFVCRRNSTITKYKAFFVAHQNVQYTLCCLCRIMQEDMANKVSEWKLIINAEVSGFLAYPRHLELLLAVHHNLFIHKQRRSKEDVMVWCF